MRAQGTCVVSRHKLGMQTCFSTWRKRRGQIRTNTPNSPHIVRRKMKSEITGTSTHKLLSILSSPILRNSGPRAMSDA